MNKAKALDLTTEVRIDNDYYIDLMVPLSPKSHCDTCQCRQYVTYSGYSLPRNSNTDLIRHDYKALVGYARKNLKLLVKRK